MQCRKRFYSITSSARASKVSGTARPSIDRPRTVQSWTRGARFEVDRRTVRDRRRGRLPGLRSFDLRYGRDSVDRRRLHRLVKSGHQISREVGVKGIHRRLVGGGSAEPDEAVRPHEDGTAVGQAGLGRIEVRA